MNSLSPPKQLPAKSAPAFDPALFEFYRAVYQIWDALQSGNIRIVNRTPASSTDTGEPGDICYDSSYVYVWTAKDVNKRVALSAW